MPKMQFKAQRTDDAGDPILIVYGTTQAAADHNLRHILACVKKFGLMTTEETMPDGGVPGLSKLYGEMVDTNGIIVKAAADDTAWQQLRENIKVGVAAQQVIAKAQATPPVDS